MSDTKGYFRHIDSVACVEKDTMLDGMTIDNFFVWMTSKMWDDLVEPNQNWHFSKLVELRQKHINFGFLHTFFFLDC